MAPLAPWVFLSASVSFALMPEIVAGHTAPYGLVFAAVTAGITLALGIGIQPYARKLDAAAASRGAVAGLLAVIAGLLVAALAAVLISWPLVLIAAVLFGAGYGLCLVSGLLEVQRLAGPGELAGTDRRLLRDYLPRLRSADRARRLARRRELSSFAADHRRIGRPLAAVGPAPTAFKRHAPLNRLIRRSACRIANPSRKWGPEGVFQAF